MNEEIKETLSCVEEFMKSGKKDLKIFRETKRKLVRNYPSEEKEIVENFNKLCEKYKIYLYEY